MTSAYLIADETVRHMAFALRSLSCSCLDSERERRGAYWDADVRADDMARLDAEALRRERIRRRLFGIVVSAPVAVACVRQAVAAPSGMEGITSGLIHEVRVAALVFLIWLGVCVIPFAVVWLVRRVRRALRSRSRPPTILLTGDVADQIWS